MTIDIEDICELANTVGVFGAGTQAARTDIVLAIAIGMATYGG